MDIVSLDSYFREAYHIPRARADLPRDKFSPDTTIAKAVNPR